MEAIDLTDIYKRYKGMWVALSPDLNKVLVHGKKADIVYRKALQLGDKRPTLFKIPTKNITYIGGGA